MKKGSSKPNAEQEVAIQAPTLYMRAGSKKRFFRRDFLTPESLDSSFVLAVVASSHEGQFVDGFNAVVLCDSTRVICLEFPLRTPEARNASLSKITLLAETLNEFRISLMSECSVIEKREETQ